MVQQGIYECAAVIPIRGMCDHSGRFIYDTEIIVFVNEFEGDILGNNFFLFFNFGKENFNAVVRLDDII